MKEKSVALSTTKEKYMETASCCAQLLWIKKKMEDFGVLTDTIPLMCDNTSTMNMDKKLCPIQEDKAHRREAQFSEG